LADHGAEPTLHVLFLLAISHFTIYVNPRPFPTRPLVDLIDLFKSFLSDIVEIGFDRYEDERNTRSDETTDLKAVLNFTSTKAKDVFLIAPDHYF
jgi:hypothetical protein